MTITPEQRTERLTQLRRVVEAAPDHLLHMRRVTELAGCGTAYCAMGWASIDPWFKKNTPIVGVVVDQWGDGDLAMNFTKAAAMFGITYGDAVALFAGGLDRFRADPHAVSKRAVLTNIDRLLRGERARPYSATRSR